MRAIKQPLPNWVYQTFPKWTYASNNFFLCQGSLHSQCILGIIMPSFQKLSMSLLLFMFDLFCSIALFIYQTVENRCTMRQCSPATLHVYPCLIVLFLTLSHKMLKNRETHFKYIAAFTQEDFWRMFVHSSSFNIIHMKGWIAETEKNKFESNLTFL